MSETAAGEVWFIRDDAALVELCRRFAAVPIFAIDTEFERSRTYFSELCLIQVAADGVIACVDPLALPDLGRLYEVLLTGEKTRILHAARQDLEVLYQAAGKLPPVIFDTQLAAALCGFTDQIGYGDIVRDLLGVALAKSATRTDWRQRPLTAEQVDYAADDVRYLAAVANKLQLRLADLGRESWLAEDCRALCSAELYSSDSTNAWQRIKGLGGLAATARTRAVALAAWRESEAKERNLPRNWVVKDQEILELANRAPRSLAGLTDSGLNPATVRRYGAVLLDVMSAPAEMDVPAERRLNSAGRAAHKELTVQVQARAKDLDISPTLLATRAELEGVISGRPSARLGLGWRHTLLGDLFEAWIKKAGEGLCE